MPEPLFSNQFVTVDTVPATTGGGVAYDHTRITSGTGMGSIIIPTHHYRGLTYLGLVTQHRPVLGIDSIEFPRGRTNNLGESEAARELAEEMGILHTTMRHVGNIHPDTGLLSTTVAVWIAAVDSDQATESRTHIEGESGAIVSWYSLPQMLALIASGKVQCAMTIAAFFKASQHNSFTGLSQQPASAT